MSSTDGRLRIGMVLDKFYPPDHRVEEEARCLTAAGHEISLFCLRRRDEPQREFTKGMQVRRFAMGETLRKKGGALSLTVPLYGRWFRRRLHPFIEENRIQVLHIHDLRLAGEGRSVARAHGIPWVLDLHENLPAIIKEYGHARTLLGRLLIYPWAWKRFEKRIVPQADRVIVVTGMAADDLVKSSGVPPERVLPVPNVASREYCERSYAPLPGPGLRAIYVGETGLRRGTDLCIRAVAILSERIPGLELVLVGTSRDQRRLRALADQLGVARQVSLLGWKDAAELPGLIESANIGLAPFRRNPHHDTTFANKLFQYMALGRPVVASDCPAQARVVESERCGLVFRSGEAEDLARCIEEIGGLSDRGKAMGDRGREAVRQRYNWDVTGKGLARMYEDLMKSEQRR